MLRLITGRAKTGKTAFVMKEIAGKADNNQIHSILIVPEQYSHEAERELCRYCGDGLSLYSEVLSFTRFYSRITSELGGTAENYIDGGGRLLILSKSLEALGSDLRIYSNAQRRPDALKGILDTITELKAACLIPEDLAQAGEKAQEPLSGKLRELSLIMGAYNALISQSGADPSDKLSRLTELLPNAGLGGYEIYIDGFTDFTGQELAVIRELMTHSAGVTVCLGCNEIFSDEGGDIFAATKYTALRLIEDAKGLGIAYEIIQQPDPDTGGEMNFIEKQLFIPETAEFEGQCDNIALYSARTISEECELAAAEIIRLVQEKSYRYKDISIAARGFDSYAPVLDSVFSYYGLPLYTSVKDSILDKSPIALITSAFEIIAGGWSYEDVFTYLKTGFLPISEDDRDRLENYVYLWNIRGSAWKRKSPWSMHPDGYAGGEYEEKDKERLNKINELRQIVSAPLIRLEERGKKAETVKAQAVALNDFLESINLAQSIHSRARELAAKGKEALGAEYLQLWDIVVGVLEQTVLALGEMTIGQEEFFALFRLMLSQYDVGTIPVSLDRVSAGDMDRMRRRNIKHLIVLGASSERLPRSGDEKGLFSEDERETLAELGLELPGASIHPAFREVGLIYNCLTLPSVGMTMSYSQFDGGSEAAPSYIMERLGKMFKLPITPADTDALRGFSLNSSLELAAGKKSPELKAFFDGNPEYSSRIKNIESASQIIRKKLSPATVTGLYGDKLRLSASRAEKYSSCNFSYFMEYGLKAKARKQAGFDPPELGNFMHSVLEGVSRDIAQAGGFQSVSTQLLNKSCDKHIARFVSEELGGYEDKSSRFVYLLRRLQGTVRKVAKDTAEELSQGDFVPLSFEFNFSREGISSPLPLPDGGELYISGVADRVDGWENDSVLYLRVVDYKTGNKEFSLSDVYNGLGLQMLMYLFALEASGEKIYGKRVLPAGVLYVPAKGVIVSAPGNLSDDTLEALQAKELKRSGLLLNDHDVLKAMENNDVPRYLPVKQNKAGIYTGQSLALSSQLGKLSKYIDKCLKELAGEIKKGEIKVNPYVLKDDKSPCTFCDYSPVCHYDEDRDGRRFLTDYGTDAAWELIEKAVFIPGEGGEDNE